ncbi:MAG: hypothetical protein EAX96_02065 [Candidatus Lokiarchaeota archaeon]|nr:hypothetical protein [Candidatus Lokiarchaeota archaeon]
MNNDYLFFKNDKFFSLIGGISCYVIAWIFYYMPQEFTTLGIFIHYISLFLIGLGLYNQSKKNKIIILIVVYLISLILDYPFYEIRHGLSLGLFYYITVNLIHITLFLSVLFMKKNETSYILSAAVFIIFGINFYLWMFMSIFPIFLITIIIFSISLPSIIGSIIYYFIQKDN